MIKQIRNIKFNEAQHKYTDEYGNVYTSVTTLIGKVGKDFDSEYWSLWTALKRSRHKLQYSEINLVKRKISINNKAYALEDIYKMIRNNYIYLDTSIETVTNEWQVTTEEACDKGNKKHKFLEDSINIITGIDTFNTNDLLEKKSDFQFLYKSRLNKVALAKSELKYKYPQVYALFVDFLSKGWQLFAEVRVYDADSLIAGTIDCLAIKGDEFVIIDWKTNKADLKFEAGYYKKVNNIVTDEWVPKLEYFNYPLKNVQYCKGNNYTLQLSLYAYILEMYGYKCKKLILYHIKDNDKTIPYNIVYMKENISKLVSYHKGENIGQLKMFNDAPSIQIKLF